MVDPQPRPPPRPYRSNLLGYEWRADSWDDGPMWKLMRTGTLADSEVGEFYLAKDGTYIWNAGIMKGGAPERDQAVGAVELSVELRERLKGMENLPGRAEPAFEEKMAKHTEVIKELVTDTLRRMHEGARAMFNPVDWVVRVEQGDKPGHVSIHLDQRKDGGVIDLGQLARTKAALEGL